MGQVKLVFIFLMYVYVLVMEYYQFQHPYLRGVYAYSFLLLDLKQKIFAYEVQEHS